MKTCERCVVLQKKYKILEAELAFEVKKLEEDMAHQKITLQMAHQKEIHKLNDRLAAQKHDKEAEIKKWFQKYDSMVRVFDLKIIEKDQECEEKIRSMEIELSKKVEQQTCKKEIKIRQEIDQLRTESQQYKKRLIHLKEEQKKLIQRFHHDEVVKTLQKFRNEKVFMEEQKERLITEIKQLQKKDLMNKTIEIQLSEENYYQKQETESLKDKIGQLEQTVKLCYGELHTKERVIEYVRKEYNQKLKKGEKQFNLQKEELIKKHKKQIQDLLEKQLNKCESFETQLKEIQEKREAQIKIYESNFKQIKILVDENKCPPKFSTQINTLKYRLTSKQRQVQRAKADIRLYQLQLQNNDEILTKFFLNPNFASTCPDLNYKKAAKEYKIKYRGSVASSNMRSTSTNKNKSTDVEYNENKTTSLQNLELAHNTKTVKLL